MSVPETAGQIKKAWTQGLRQALHERGFSPASDGTSTRPFDGGSDVVVLRLRAAGRGSTRVDVLDLAVGVTVHAAEEQAAALRGTEVNPDKPTVVEDLFALAGRAPDRDLTPRHDLVVLSPAELPRATEQVLRLVDEVAEPWLDEHHDLLGVLSEFVGTRSAHQLGSLETFAVLALQLGDRAACRELLAEHEALLASRGADLPAFAENRRWQAGLTTLLADDA